MVCLYLSRCYRFGLGVEVNLEKSLRYLDRAIDLPEAQYEMGESCFYGYHGRVDLKSACDWYEVAASNGYTISRYDLAYCFRHGIGRPQDFQKSLVLYESAANDGHPPSQNNLAFLYQQGLGDAVRKELALYWFQQAALAGYEPAIFNVGVMYLKGYGTKKDVQAAIQCFKRTQGYGPSQHQLGLCSAGGVGVEVNPHEAFYWFHLAAQQGVPAVCNDVALLYELGIGTQKDIKEAIKWYRQAVEFGDPSASENLDSLFKEHPEFRFDNVPEYLLPVPIKENELLLSIGFQRLLVE